MDVDIVALKNQLLTFHARLRMSPRSVIPIFEDREPFYKDNLYFIKNKPKKAIRTKQGYGAVKQLIDELKRLEPFDDILYSRELERAAQDYAYYLSRQSQIETTSNDLQQRVQNYTDWEGHLFQCVEYGFVEPEQILINLLVDDGLKNRPNRRNILNPESKFYGIGLARHPQYNVVAVIIYATQLRNKIEEVAVPIRVSVRKNSRSQNHQDSEQPKKRNFQITQQGQNPNKNWCQITQTGNRCLLF